MGFIVGTPVGSALILIGALHSFVGAWRFAPILGGMFRDGLFNTVRTGVVRAAVAGDGAWHGSLVMVERAFATWYLYTGFALVLLGLAVRALERRGDQPPGSLAAGLVAFAAVAVTVAPLSAGWLLLIPAAIILRQRVRAAQHREHQSR